MQISPSTGLSVVALLVSLSVAAFAWRRRGTPGSRPVAAFTVGTAVWTGGNALQSASTTLHDKLFWVDVQYVGIAVVPLAWFAFACEYADRGEWADRRALALLGSPFLALIVLAWTNDYHHLVRTSSELVTVGGNARLDRTFGPAFWAGWIYSNLVTGVGTVLLLRTVVRSRRIYRRQAFAILAGTTVPWVASGMFYNGLTSLEPEVFFSVSAVAFAYAIAQYDMLDVRPIGRNVVIEEMDDGVLVLDGEDRLVDANPAAARVFGWPDVDSVVGRPIADVGLPRAELLGDSTAGRASDALAVEAEDGTRRYFDVRRSTLADEATPASGTVVILRDVTERKRQEARLERQNERLEEVGSTIAHDLRNPLSVADGHLELAREVGTEQTDEHLEKIGAAHDRMEEIIDEVLEMARGEEPTADGRVGLRAVAESAWENVDTGRGDLAFDGAEVELVADDRRLTSLFENLFRNSVDHGGPDATVRVGVLDREGFYVEDDGPGVPEDVRERVFERGFTTTDEGTGVGLAVVSDVAEAHDWEVAVTESEAGGARFEVRGVELAAGAPVPE